MWTWSWRGKRAANTRAGLREANAERSKIILTSECTVCSQYQNVEETLCTFWVLAKTEPLCYAKVRFFLRAKHVFVRKSPRRSGSYFSEVAKTPKIKVISFEIAKQNVFCSLLFMVLWPKLDYACVKTCGRFWDNFCDVHLRYVLVPWNFFPIYFSMSWPLKQAKPTMASTRDSNLQCPRIVDFGRLCHGSCHRL